MLFTKKSIILAIVFIGLFFSSAFAANLDVCPTGCAYSSIQAAVNAASDGDTIRVAQGLYFENIYIYDPIDVTIEGGWDSTFSTRSPDPALTVVNGMGLGNVFYINAYDDESITVTIEGLTITNGSNDNGGGIYARASAGTSCTTNSNLNLTLSNNRIVENRATWGGGGIYVYAYTSSDNGRAIVYLTLSNNRISDNSACGDGGGIYMYGSSSSSYTKESVLRFGLTGNEINGNYASYYGGGYISLYRTDYEHGGSSSFIEANDINGNEALYGGGLYLDLDNCSPATLEIVNNVISGNVSQYEYGTGGIKINSDLSQAIINFTNNTVTRNAGMGLDVDADGDGGVLDDLVLNLYNNIIWGNHLASSGSDEIDLNNQTDGNMVVNSGSNNLGQLDINDVTYNDIGDNLTTDPLIGDDFHLCTGSPAIDTADAAEAPGMDKDGHARVAAPAPDRGAYEYLGSDHQAELSAPGDSYQREYQSIPQPIVASDPAVARPLTAYVDNNTLHTEIALPDFSSPVDVYAGFSYPWVDPDNIYQLANDLTLKTIASHGLVKWQSGLTGAIEISPIADMNTANLPRAEYFIYLIVVPEGDSPLGPKYYDYRTSFIIK